MTLTIGSLCTGTGGLDMAVGAALGGELAWYSEFEPPTKKRPTPSQAAAKLLAHRYPDVPNLGDMTAVDWEKVEKVDIITGGTPCQDVSHAGARRGMRAGTRSGIWASMVDAIDVLRPGIVVWENVRGVTYAEADSDLEPCPICMGDGSGDALRALGRVLGDLADVGYDAEWIGLPASDIDAPHERFRVFLVAYPRGSGWDARWAALCRDRAQADPSWRGATVAYADGARLEGELAGGYGSEEPEPVSTAGSVADATSDARRIIDGGHADGRTLVDWGRYRDAVERWERVLGRPAPMPSRPNKNGTPKLSPDFDEWLMGLPAGWVSEVPGISWNDMLKLCGNGVVPQQAIHAMRVMATRKLLT